MEQTESHTQSFIIKIWLEETAAEDGRAIWRGHITHVPGGERRYLKNLDDIASFMAPYLEPMGGRSYSRICRPSWFKRLMTCIRRRSHQP
jgi:hypothetical protein